jgi:hypothetical protein
MNVTTYIKECAREQHESEANEPRRQRWQSLRETKPLGRRNTYVREVLPSGCILYKVAFRQSVPTISPPPPAGTP